MHLYQSVRWENKRRVVTQHLGEGVQMHTGEPESSLWMLMNLVLPFGMFETEGREHKQEHGLQSKIQNNVSQLRSSVTQQENSSQFSVLSFLCQFNNYFGFQVLWLKHSIMGHISLKTQNMNAKCFMTHSNLILNMN